MTWVKFTYLHTPQIGALSKLPWEDNIEKGEAMAGGSDMKNGKWLQYSTKKNIWKCMTRRSGANPRSPRPGGELDRKLLE